MRKLFSFALLVIALQATAQLSDTSGRLQTIPHVELQFTY